MAVPAPVPTVAAQAAPAASNAEPESVPPADDALGPGLWKNSSRPMVEHLLQILNLPVSSAALNNLAQRFLLSTASAPDASREAKSDTSGTSLIGLRAEKLLALGDAQDAWKLIEQGKSDKIDEITYRMVAEGALLTPQRDDVCLQLPDIIKTHNSPEWQKLALICQLRANDTKAAQLTLDLMHAQGVKDDIFFYIAEKTVMGNGKQLPRQLTPLKPLTLALLRMTDLALPGEIYMHPDAALIKELLLTKSHEENARVGLAERAAERGLLSAPGLAAVYTSVSFTPEALAAANNSPETGPRLHALMYQAAMQDKEPLNRIKDSVKFMQSATPALLAGPGGAVLALMIGKLSPAPEYNQVSGLVAYVYTLANKPEAALEWIRLAKHAAIGIPAVAAELQSFWPLAVLTGLESDHDYSADLDNWLTVYLKPADPKSESDQAQRDQASSVLLLLEATGFAVPEDVWARLTESASFERHIVPSALLLERLRVAASSNRRGETIGLALAVNGGGDAALSTVIATVRALRQVGLTADAATLSREAAAAVLLPKP